MGVRGELFSVKQTIGKRTYFFNVKENRHSDVFLNIVESKKNDEGVFERRSVIVFQEDIRAFTEAFQKVLDYIENLDDSEFRRRMERLEDQESSSNNLDDE